MLNFVVLILAVKCLLSMVANAVAPPLSLDFGSTHEYTCNDGKYNLTPTH